VLDDGTIDISVYRKKTHTDRYLDYNSHHALQHKASVVKTLFTRASVISTSERNKMTEEHHLHNVLTNMNGYPKSFVIRFKNKRNTNETNEANQEEDVLGFASLPNIKGLKDVTEQIERILQSNNIKTSTRPINTLRQRLPRPKDSLSTENRTGVVYEIPCRL